MHYNNLMAFKHNKQFLQQQFPQKLTQVDISKLENFNQHIIDDDDLMKELEEIIAYALNQMNATKRVEGKAGSGVSVEFF